MRPTLNPVALLARPLVVRHYLDAPARRPRSPGAHGRGAAHVPRRASATEIDARLRARRTELDRQLLTAPPRVC